MPPQTRSGKDFSPYLDAAPIASPPLFELGVLLQASMARESDGLEEGPFQGLQLGGEDGGEAPPARKRPASPTLPGQSRAHRRRRQARDKKAVEGGQFPGTRTVASYVVPSAPLPTGLGTEGLPAAKGGYSAKLGKAAGAKEAREAARLVEEEGFDYVAWDG